MGRLGCDVCTGLQQLLCGQPGNSSTWCSKWLGQFLPCKREQGKQDDVQDKTEVSNHYRPLILFLPDVISAINGAPKGIRYHSILNPYRWCLTLFCFQNPNGFPWRAILLIILWWIPCSSSNSQVDLLSWNTHVSNGYFGLWSGLGYQYHGFRMAAN